MTRPRRYSVSEAMSITQKYINHHESQVRINSKVANALRSSEQLSPSDNNVRTHTADLYDLSDCLQQEQIIAPRIIRFSFQRPAEDSLVPFADEGQDERSRSHRHRLQSEARNNPPRHPFPKPPPGDTTLCPSDSSSELHRDASSPTLIDYSAPAARPRDALIDRVEGSSGMLNDQTGQPKQPAQVSRAFRWKLWKKQPPIQPVALTDPDPLLQCSRSCGLSHAPGVIREGNGTRGDHRIIPSPRDSTNAKKDVGAGDGIQISQQKLDLHNTPALASTSLRNRGSVTPASLPLTRPSSDPPTPPPKPVVQNTKAGANFQQQTVLKDIPVDTLQVIVTNNSRPDKGKRPLRPSKMPLLQPAMNELPQGRRNAVTSEKQGSGSKAANHKTNETGEPSTRVPIENLNQTQRTVMGKQGAEAPTKVSSDAKQARSAPKDQRKVDKAAQDRPIPSPAGTVSFPSRLAGNVPTTQKPPSRMYFTSSLLAEPSPVGEARPSTTNRHLSLQRARRPDSLQRDIATGDLNLPKGELDFTRIHSSFAAGRPPSTAIQPSSRLLATGTGPERESANRRIQDHRDFTLGLLNGTVSRSIESAPQTQGQVVSSNTRSRHRNRNLPKTTCVPLDVEEEFGSEEPPTE